MRVTISRASNTDCKPLADFVVHFHSENEVDFQIGEAALKAAKAKEIDGPFVLAKFLLDMADRRTFTLEVKR
jgi:hypothetical protein